MKKLILVILFFSTSITINAQCGSLITACPFTITASMGIFSYSGNITTPDICGNTYYVVNGGLSNLCDGLPVTLNVTGSCFGFDWYDETSGTPILLSSSNSYTFTPSAFSGPFTLVVKDAQGDSATISLATNTSFNSCGLMVTCSKPMFNYVDSFSNCYNNFNGIGTLNVCANDLSPITFSYSSAAWYCPTTPTMTWFDDMGNIIPSTSNTFTVPPSTSNITGYNSTYDIIISININILPTPTACGISMSSSNSITFNYSGGFGNAVPCGNITYSAYAEAYVCAGQETVNFTYTSPCSTTLVWYDVFDNPIPSYAGVLSIPVSNTHYTGYSPLGDKVLLYVFPISNASTFITPTSTSIPCSTGCCTEITANANNLNYTYSWSPIISNNDTITVCPTTTTTYTVLVTDASNSCTYSKTITINPVVYIDTTCISSVGQIFNINTGVDLAPTFNTLNAGFNDARWQLFSAPNPIVSPAIPITKGYTWFEGKSNFISPVESNLTFSLPIGHYIYRLPFCVDSCKTIDALFNFRLLADNVACVNILDIDNAGNVVNTQPLTLNWYRWWAGSVPPVINCTTGLGVTEAFSPSIGFKVNQTLTLNQGKHFIEVNVLNEGGSTSLNIWGDMTASTITNINSGSCAFALPLTILNFTAKATPQNQVLLNWETENEVNFSHFEIERSIDGKHFNKIGKVEKNSNHVYNFTDEFPFSINYYRLKQMDEDGKFEYSKTAIVELNIENTITLYPNPAAYELNIQCTNAFKTPTTICIKNAVGQEVKREIIDANTFMQTINVSSLSNGIYFVEINNKTSNKHLTFSKK